MSSDDESTPGSDTVKGSVLTGESSPPVFTVKQCAAETKMYSLISAAVQKGVFEPAGWGATTFTSPSADVPFSTALAGDTKLLRIIKVESSTANLFILECNEILNNS